jgi:hypothetical protein
MRGLPKDGKIISATLYWRGREIKLNQNDVEKLEAGEKLKLILGDDWLEDKVTFNNHNWKDVQIELRDKEIEERDNEIECLQEQVKRLAKVIKKGKNICNNLGIDLDEL